MKKIVTLLTVSCMALFFACGPSAEDKAAADKAKQDSIALATKNQHEMDSLKEVNRLDSIARANEADSLKNVAATAGAKGSKGTTTGPKKTTDEKNMDQIKDLKGGTKTPAEEKKDKENLDKIKNLKGGK